MVRVHLLLLRSNPNGGRAISAQWQAGIKGTSDQPERLSAPDSGTTNPAIGGHLVPLAIPLFFQIAYFAHF